MFHDEHVPTVDLRCQVSEHLFNYSGIAHRRVEKPRGGAIGRGLARTTPSCLAVVKFCMGFHNLQLGLIATMAFVERVTRWEGNSITMFSSVYRKPSPTQLVQPLRHVF